MPFVQHDVFFMVVKKTRENHKFTCAAAGQYSTQKSSQLADFRPRERPVGGCHSALSGWAPKNSVQTTVRGLNGRVQQHGN